MSRRDDRPDRPETSSVPPVTRIAVVGGGNGISVVLRGLARRVAGAPPLEISAIVATADDGGSSGRLREERGGVPPGDLRNCLLALATGTEDRFARLFSHRYDGAGGLAGHSLGNLILAAMAEQEGSWLRAAATAGEMLGAQGRVLPVTPGGVRLEAEARDGIRISGESRIGRSHCAIHRVWLDPESVEPSSGVLDTLRNADLVVLGPGSLFTSLLAVLLVPGVADAFRESRGRRVLVANLMTQPGETFGMDLADHLEALDRHVGAGLLEIVVAHSAAVDPERVRPYEEQGAEPLAPTWRAPRSERILTYDLVTSSGKIRHDSGALADSLLGLAPGADSVAGERAPVDMRSRPRS